MNWQLKMMEPDYKPFCWWEFEKCRGAKRGNITSFLCKRLIEFIQILVNIFAKPVMTFNGTGEKMDGAIHFLVCKQVQTLLFRLQTTDKALCCFAPDEPEDDPFLSG